MKSLFTGLLAVVLLLVSAPAAGAAPAEQVPLSHGALVSLAGTSHLWIADESGVLHWAGDTRALAGRTVDWGNRRVVSLAELRSLNRGAPWLSAGLLKDGDPIFFVKWETSDETPQLLHIQSIADVELFGIDGGNYGQFVLERAAWERRFGLSAANLRRGVLASAVGSPASSVSAPPASSTASAPTSVQRGALAGAISSEERTAFFESALTISRRQTVTKWAEPIRVQLGKTSYPNESEIVDGMVAEARGLLNGLSITRVASGGNIVINFVPRTEVVAVGGPDTLGYATHRSRENGTFVQCAISVAHDPESYLGANARHVSPQMKTDLLGLVIRHEFGHCLGLGHNNSDKSFMSYSYDPWDSYYTRGARTAQFGDFDRALLRTLYHSSIRPGMTRADLSELFAS